MTLKEYDAKMERYYERLNNGDDVMDEMTGFQYEFMNKVLDEYKAKADTPAKEVCYELLEYAVRYSTSGSSVVYVKTKELADAVKDIINEEIGDYMLDIPEIYEVDGAWAIDCMFAGYYVPEWN